MTEQQRQILLQAKKKLHLELVRDLDLVPERPKPKEELRRMLEEWGDDSEMENQRIQADQEKVWPQECVWIISLQFSSALRSTNNGSEHTKL